MRLKRLYEHVPDGSAPHGVHKITQAPLRVSGVRVLETKRLQRLSQNVIDGGAREGWLSMGRGVITLHGVDGDVVYHIVRTPGGYCCHCEAPVEIVRTIDADGLTLGARHVRDVHGGAPSPDTSNPSGYRDEPYYTCVLVGDEANVQSPGEAATFEAQTRAAFWGKLRERYGALRPLPPIAGGADLVFNIAKGRVAELYNRVDLNDPAAAELVIMLLATTGLESDATLIDLDTFAAVVAGTTNEATNTGYAKKVLGDADIVAFAPDDTNDRVDLDIPDQTWTGLANDGTGAISRFVTGYDPVGSQTMTDIVPMTIHTFVVTPDGSDVTAQIAAAGFYRAS